MRAPWPLAAALLLAALLFTHSRPAAVLLYALIVLWGGSTWLVRAVAARLVIRQRVAPTHVTPGHPVAIEVAVQNRSHLPLPWLWLREPVPVHLELSGRLQAYTAVAPAARSLMRFALRPQRRGRYRVGHIAFRMGDWFGVATLEGELDFDHWLTVYPAILRLPPLPLSPLLPVGPRQDRRSPFHDDLTIGVRDYLPGDPWRAIAWKASARHDRLQVRIYPRVRERSTTLLLDLNRPAWRGPAQHTALERALSVAASYAWSQPTGHPLGLLTYGHTVRYVPEGAGTAIGAARWLWLKPKPGLPQRRAVLEVLAGIDAADGGPDLPHLLSRARAGLQPGEALLILTAGHDAAGWLAASATAARGHSVSILGFLPRPLPACPGVQVLPVTLDGEVRWA